MAHVIDEVLRAPLGAGDISVTVLRAANQHVAPVVCLRCGCFLCRNCTSHNHCIKHRSATIDCSLATALSFRIVLWQLRIGSFRGANESSEIRRFGQRDLIEVLAEVGASCCFNSVGTTAEINRVEVASENFLFRKFTFNLHRESRFFDLSGNRAFLCEINVLHVLLCDG